MRINIYIYIYIIGIQVLLLNSGAFAQVPQSWTSIGIGGGGAIFSPSINPSNTTEFYVSSDMGELFHSTNFGNSYSEMNFMQLQGGKNSRVAFTSNPDIRYCINYRNNLVVPVRSTDGGNTWSSLTGNPNPAEVTYGLWADESSTDRLVIAYYGSLWFSSDAGQTFHTIHQAATSSGVFTAGVFFDGQNIFIGTNDGLLVSHNNGLSFTIENTSGIPQGQVIYSFAGAKQGNTTCFFAITGDAGNVSVGLGGNDYWNFIRGVYRMDDANGTWTLQMSGILPSSDWMMFVTMSLHDINTVYLAGSTPLSEPNVMKTTNGGQSWEHVFITSTNQNITTGWCGEGGDRGWSYAECPFGFTVSSSDPNKIVMTDYGFVHTSNDGGNSWKQAYVTSSDQNPAGTSTPIHSTYQGIGLENTSCWHIQWSSPTELFAGFSDIKGVRSEDGGSSWSFNYSGMNQNSTYRVVKNISNLTLYAATSSIHDIYQSTHLQDNLLDASNATGSILYSTDQGTNWQTLHDFGHPVFWVAIDPNNANRLYAAVVNHTQNAGGIWVSSNINLGSNSTWTQLSSPGRTEGHPHSIVILDDGTLLCTYTGRRNTAGSFTQSSGVFIYNPGLQVWSDKSANGMFYWTRDITIDPADPTQNTWLVSVFSGWGGAPNGLGGLYKTTDRGNSWNKINSLDRVSSCTFNPTNHDQVFICSEGDGLWTSLDIHSANPVFQQVQSYPFYYPWKVFFNPYNHSEVWVSSFGNGMKKGNITPTGIKFNYAEENETSIFPNPANNYTDFSNLVDTQTRKVELVDGSGKEISVPVNDSRIDISSLQDGVYFVKISGGKNTLVKKLIVKK